MFLHIGNNQMIELADVIAIINLQSVHGSQDALQLLDNLLHDKEKLKSLNEDDAKSLIISEGTFYYSSISATTLLERSKFPWVS